MAARVHSILYPAVAAGQDVLRKRLRAIALAGRLCVRGIRAVSMMQAGCAGTVFTLLEQPVEQRDAGLSKAAREAVIAAITVEAADAVGRGPNTAAAALSAGLDRTSVLSTGEKASAQGVAEPDCRWPLAGLR